MMNNQYWYNAFAVAFSLVFVIRSTTEARPENSSLMDMDEHNTKSCQPDRLTVYRVTLNTFWNHKNFPKHYPQWRPPAQWSKLVGRSHNKSYILYRLNHKATRGLKLFAEDGRSDYLDTQSQGEGGIYDEFNAPAILSGEGKTETEFFVDGNHSRVSLISKLVPSPDWFIGIDSLDLCANGKWLNGISIEVDVVDAGTDNGFSFTSPNWASEPQENIRHLSSNFPNHPASAFFYPGVRKLPTIAVFQFFKIKEYELSKVFNYNDEKISQETKKMEQVSSVTEDGNTSDFHDNTTNLAVAVVRDSENLTRYSIENDTAKSEKEKNFSSNNTKEIFWTYTTEGTTEKNADELNGLASLPLHVPDTTTKSKAKPVKATKAFLRNRLPRDCDVGVWSAWSPCSKTCDIGVSERYRKVINHARRGGRPCPSLEEKKWCGSARSCSRSYFNWS
ncbi:spondin-1-like [Daphnia carinata]|uniref:spondin-1-like n=1 Tax=Daphnia carinata TaxID=120202 RepID=UPI00257E74F8|nr:spondin-1-like [Daphnia carinata]